MPIARSLAALLLAGCAAPGSTELAPGRAAPTPDALAALAGVTLSTPPFDPLHVAWKERRPQGYVFVEARREGFGEAMRGVLALTAELGLEASGPPFGLFDGALSRACVPVDEDPGDGRVAFGVLPGAMVAYAVVSGPYEGIGEAWKGLSEVMHERGWERSGPVREIYLVVPSEAADPGALAAEIQVPWVSGP